MNGAVLLIMMLSNQGYWLGGQEGTVEIRWAVQGGLPEADLIWDLMFGTIRVGNGKVAMKAGDEPTVLTVGLPAVRVRTRLTLVCRAIARGDGRQLAVSQAAIQVFPSDLLDGVAHRLGKRKLFVIDGDDGLVKALEAANIPFTRLKDPAALRMQEVDLILVGSNQLRNSAFEQAPLIAQAQTGASVFFFAQDRPDHLAGYPLWERALPPQLQWRQDHPLFYELSIEDTQTWLVGRKTARAVQLPADEPAMEIAFWPRESPGWEPTPIDALVVSKAVGKGRVTMCQLPLGAFDQDPRSQILLRNVIDYLLSRPQPTPSPSKRQPVKDSGGQKTASGVSVP